MTRSVGKATAHDQSQDPSQFVLKPTTPATRNVEMPETIAVMNMDSTNGIMKWCIHGGNFFMEPNIP